MQKGSRYSLDRRRPKQKASKKSKQRRRPQQIRLRFDDVAVAVVCAADVECTVAANLDPSQDDWHSPKATVVANAIFERFVAFPVAGGGSYKDLLTARNARLVVAIVSDLDATQITELVPLNDGAFSGEEINYRRILIVFAAEANATESSIDLAEDRRKIALRKVSCPGGRCVSGPYLVVAAIDNASNVTLRARIFPVWVSPDRDCIALVRSGYERAAAGAIHAIGGMLFMPLRISQLERLQRAFGSRWVGDLTTYGFLPDAILFPNRDGLVTILEIFGLTRFKKYEEGKRKKEKKVLLKEGPNTYSFLAIQTAELRNRDASDFIRARIAAWYDEEWRQLWRKRPAEGLLFMSHAAG